MNQLLSRYLQYVTVLVTCLLSINTTSANATALESIFSHSYTRLEAAQYSNLDNAGIAVDSGIKDILSTHCQANVTRYTRHIQTTNNSSIFRIPHSGIFSDGASCGTKPAGASDDELWLDSHMTLAPAQLLATQETASELNLGAMYQAIQLDEFRAHARKSMADLVSLLGDVWVGYEGISDRVCGGTTVLPRNSVVLFARTKTGSATTLSFQLAHPSNTNQTDILEFTFGGGEDIELTISEQMKVTTVDYDRICPAHVRTSPLAGNPPTTSESKAKPACFPASAQVWLSNGTAIRMELLSVGNKVLDVDGSYSEIFLFTHHDSSDSLHQFVQITADDGSSLTISEGHYVATPDGIAPAGSIFKGSYLVKLDGSFVKITEKRIIPLRGMYNPQTLSGSLVVDGFAVSAYTTAVPPMYAHMLLSPLRAVYKASRAEWYTCPFLAQWLSGRAEHKMWLRLLWKS
jgi:Hint module